MNNYSPLRYPGGKAKLYTLVKTIMEENNLIGGTYVEPFAGGAGLALKLLINNDVKRIIINDLDIAIYSIWYSILNLTKDFCDLIENTEVSVEEWKKQKNIYSKGLSGNTLQYGFAAFFLNRTNVSGVIKGGMIGGNCQSGSYKIDARFNKSDLINRIKLISKYKNSIILYNMDANELINGNFLKYYHKVFINFDPPYVKKGLQLYKNSFSEQDHRLLSYNISRCKKKWIVTYDICPLVKELYDDFSHDIININYSVNTPKKAQEYIFFSKNLKVKNDSIDQLEELE